MEWKELLPDSSLSHLDYESRIYDIGLCGTSMRIFATSSRSSTERHGDFSESVVFHFTRCPFWFGCWVVCVFCVCW